MNLKRAIGFSVLAYIATFIIALAAAAAMGIESPDIENIPTSMWIIGVLSAVVLVSLAAWLYFRPSHVQASSKNGFLFGIIAVITGFVLDIVTVLPTGGISVLFDYYSQQYFWVTLVAILLGTTMLGAKMSDKETTGVPPVQQVKN